MNITICCYVIKRILLLRIIYISVFLITIRETTHTTHDSENIVVHSEHLNVVPGFNVGKVEGSIVDARHVARAGRLVFLGLEGEGIHVDRLVNGGGDTLVVLVRLNKLVVGGLSRGGAVVAVELDVALGVRGDVFTNLASRRLLNPDELLHGVVEVELELGLSLLVAGELKLLDEVFVSDLGESAALIGVEVDVIDIEGGGIERGGRSVSKTTSCSDHAVAGRSKLYIHLHLVVLKSDQGKSKTGVAAEPELKRDEQSSLLAGTSFAICDVITGVRERCGLAVSSASIGTGNHDLVTFPVTLGLGELVPDVEPVAVVLVDSLTTDFNLYGLDELVSNPISVVVSVQFGESNLNVNTVDEITVSGDGAGYLLVETSGTVEGLVDGLHREVRVSAVHNLEESDLRVTGKVDVLSAIGNELHKSSTHFVFNV